MKALIIYKRISLMLSLGYMGLIFHLSSKPSLPIPPLFPYQDKLFHFTAYGILGFLLSSALPEKKIWVPALLASLYGISDEFHQSFVPGRSCDLLDWFADSFGAISGSYLFFILWKKVFREILLRYQRKE